MPPNDHVVSDTTWSVDEAEAGGGDARLVERKVHDELGAVGREDMLAEQHGVAPEVRGSTATLQQRSADRYGEEIGLGDNLAMTDREVEGLADI